MCFGNNITRSASPIKANKQNAKSMKARPYVGIKHPKKTETFKSATKANTDTHPQYHTVKGPFKTNKGASFLANHANPKAMSQLSVSELERLASELNGTGGLS